jgi:hypothetical protein
VTPPGDDGRVAALREALERIYARTNEEHIVKEVDAALRADDEGRREADPRDEFWGAVFPDPSAGEKAAEWVATWRDGGCGCGECQRKGSHHVDLVRDLLAQPRDVQDAIRDLLAGDGT